MTEETKTAQENTEAAEANAQAQQTAEQAGGSPDGQQQAERSGPDGEGQGQVEDFTFTPPEGIDLDPAAVDGFKEIVRRHGLKSDAAKEVAEYGASLFAKQQQAIDAQVTKWADETLADPELSRGFERNIALAESALKTFGDDTLITMLRTTGLGNHPAVIRFCWKVGKALGEPKPAEEKDSGNAPVQAETAQFAGALFENSLKGE